MKKSSGFNDLFSHPGAPILWRSYTPFFPPEMRFDPDAVTETRFTWRGHSIRMDRLPAHEAPLKVLVLHGIGGYGRVLLHFGVPLHRAGYEVLAPDLPGYGLTKVDGRPRFGDWVDLAAEIIERESADGRPVVVYGMSMGGVVAYHAACRTNAAGIVASTLADLRSPRVIATYARFSLLTRYGLPTLRFFPFLHGLRLPAALLARMGDIANVREMAALCGRDPLGGGASLPLGFFYEVSSQAPALEPEEFRRPVLIVHPAEDRMTDISCTREFYERLASPKRFVELPGAGHFPLEALDQLNREVLDFLGGVRRGREPFGSG
jgi:alpha-beta hydrolase superfamily lysophospholipase